jgi:hypothetical protein
MKGPQEEHPGACAGELPKVVEDGLKGAENCWADTAKDNQRGEYKRLRSRMLRKE